MDWIFHHLTLALSSPLPISIDSVRPRVTVKNPAPHASTPSRPSSIPASTVVLILLSLSLPLTVHSVGMALTLPLRSVVSALLVLRAVGPRALHVTLLLVRHSLHSGRASRGIRGSGGGGGVGRGWLWLSVGVVMSALVSVCLCVSHVCHLGSSSSIYRCCRDTPRGCVDHSIAVLVVRTLRHYTARGRGHVALAWDHGSVRADLLPVVRLRFTLAVTMAIRLLLLLAHEGLLMLAVNVTIPIMLGVASLSLSLILLLLMVSLTVLLVLPLSLGRNARTLLILVLVPIVATVTLLRKAHLRL